MHAADSCPTLAALEAHASGDAIDPAIDLDLGGRTFTIGFAEGDVFEFFVDSLSLNIANFVTIGGGLEFSSNRLVLSGGELFLGQGPASLPDGSLNPSARGVLVHMKPQPLGYIVHDGYKYMFPRHDALVLGGCFDADVDDPTPPEHTVREILEHHRRFFARG